MSLPVMFLFIITGILCISIAILAFYAVEAFSCLCKPKCACSNNPPTSIRDLPQATALLRTSKLSSRARPNRRLVLAFSISNAFTTTDPAFHKAFLSISKSLLRTSDDSWPILVEQTRAILKEPVTSTIENGISLVSLVQSVCFRFVLFKFFPSTQGITISSRTVTLITRAINELWISSKCSCAPGHSHMGSKKKLLRNTLASIFPDSPTPCPDEENPLNILLPAYETLWRIVLRCFLQVAFAYPPSNKFISTTVRYRAAFKSFLANPSSEQFTIRTKDEYCSAKDIVYESLRLWPPTRRIYRQEHENGAVLAVDVEFLQRTESIWGDEAGEFRPERWVIMNGEARTSDCKEAWMPFGKGSFQCPAIKMAPMMIGILVGGLIEEFGNGEWLLGDVADGLGDKQLENGRESFAEIILTKVGKEGKKK